MDRTVLTLVSMGPDNAEKLTASALKELQNIIDNGPDEKM
jgi:hypothetical protein